MHVPAVVASVGRTAVWEDEIDTLTRADDREHDGDDTVVYYKVSGSSMISAVDSILAEAADMVVLEQVLG
jgi:hypothetical protein